MACFRASSSVKTGIVLNLFVYFWCRAMVGAIVRMNFTIRAAPAPIGSRSGL
jgi:hypothetical protein